VFIVDEQYVIKLYTHFFNGAASYAVEAALYAAFAQAPTLPVPKLIARGSLFPQDEAWSWPYIVTTAIPGTSLGEVVERVSAEDRVQVAIFLSPLLRQLHSLPLAGLPGSEDPWRFFLHFLEAQHSACVHNHETWQTMPNHLIAQIEAYLLPLAVLVEEVRQPHLLHCDLNADHVLEQFEEDHWQPAGIIDFGDARIGDRLYELPALHIGLFACDKHLLQHFLRSYGFDAELRRQFVQRAMSFTLLHQFDVLAPVFETFPHARAVASLDELATLLWDLERPGLTNS
jgi:hygromycin-B 7''-O-kinase